MVDKMVRLPSSLTELQDKRQMTEVGGDELHLLAVARS